jgi:hypothetical protein
MSARPVNLSVMAHLAGVTLWHSADRIGDDFEFPDAGDLFTIGDMIIDGIQMRRVISIEKNTILLVSSRT